MLTRSSGIKIVLIILLCLVICGGLLACSNACTSAARQVGSIAGDAIESINFEERGDFEIPAADVHNLEINWAAGEVEVVVSEDAGTSAAVVRGVEELGGSLRDADRMTWQLRNGVLQIGYGLRSSNMFGCMQMGSKRLVLTLPKSTAQALESVELHAASGSYDFGAISCRSMDISVASGQVNANELDAQYLSLDVASGTVKLSGHYTQMVTCNLASGNIDITCKDECPARSAFDVASGHVTLTVPEESGITAHIDKLSGSFDCDIPGEWDLPDYNRFTCGDGTCEMTVSLMSGRVAVQEA